MKYKIGTLLLAIYLIAHGTVSAFAVISPPLYMIIALLAIAAGIFILLDR